MCQCHQNAGQQIHQQFPSTLSHSIPFYLQYNQVTSIKGSLKRYQRPCQLHCPDFSQRQQQSHHRHHPENATNIVDKGPQSNEPAAADFRKNWDNKAEIRRFIDGSFTESVLWCPAREPIIEKRLICHGGLHIFLVGKLPVRNEEDPRRSERTFFLVERVDEIVDEVEEEQYEDFEYLEADSADGCVSDMEIETQRQETSMQFQCDICPRSFHSNRGLRIHRAACARKFRNQSALL
jgi:Nrap protein domain 3